MGEGKGDIMHLLQPMVGSLLHMAPNLLHMAPNLLLMAPKLLLMMHLVLNHNQAMVLAQGQPMMQLLQLTHLLPTAFLLVMGGNLLLMVLRNLHMVLNHLLMVLNLLHMAPNILELSNNLELSSSLLLYLRLDQLDQCNLIV